MHWLVNGPPKFEQYQQPVDECTVYILKRDSENINLNLTMSDTNEIGPSAMKKQRVAQRYRSEYAMRYPIITKSSMSDSHAYCNLCKVDINIGHGGLTDITKHVGTVKHSTKAALHTNMRKVPE